MKGRKFSRTKLMKDQKGLTLVELITAMAVMSILTVAYFSLFFACGNTYDVVYDGYKAQNEARIAMSFLTVKIRQNDKIIIDPDPASPVERNAVILRDDMLGRKYMRIDGDTVEFIYPFDTGTGKSLIITDTESDLFTGSGRLVAERLRDIIMEYDPVDNNKIVVTISYENGGIDTIEETIALRAKN